MQRDIRAAAIGGLAATFVVAASLAPKLMSHPSEVTVHHSSTDAAGQVLDEVEGSTSTTAAGDTAPTSTSEPSRTTTTTAGLEQRVTKVEQRVTVIEQLVTPTTTTTTSTTNSTVPPVTATTTPVRPAPKLVEIARYEFGPEPVTKVTIPYITQTGWPDVRAFWAEKRSDVLIRVDVDKLANPMTPGDTTYARSPQSTDNLWTPSTTQGEVILTLTLDSGLPFVPPHLVTVEEYR